MALEALPPDARAEIDAAIKGSRTRYQATAIAGVLEAEFNVYVSALTIQRHRNGVCKCPTS